MPHSTSSASITDEPGQGPQSELCTGKGHPDQCIDITISSHHCTIHNMTGGAIPLSDLQAIVDPDASMSPSLVRDFQPVTDDSPIDISVCIDCRIRAPTLPPDSTRAYQVYKIAVRAPPEQRGPFHVLFVAHRGDIYGFAGTYIFVDGYLDRDNKYHEHLSNETPGSSNHISYEIIASIPAANMQKLKELCRNFLPPRKQVDNGWEFCPWEPLYRSEDWIDDIIIMGGRSGLLTPSSSYLLEMISEDEEEEEEQREEESEEESSYDTLIFPFTL